MRAEERDLIVKHALESPEHLRISLQVHFSFEAIKREVITKALVSIRDRVEVGIGGDWPFRQSEVSAVEKGFRLRLRKKSWPEGLWVGLEWNRAEEQFAFLFARFWPPGEPRSEDEELRNTLAQELAEVRPGKIDEPFLWWGFPRRYRSWDSEETLLLLSTSAVVTEYFATLLLDLCRIADRVIGDRSNFNAG